VAASHKAMSLSPGTISLFSGTQAEQSADPACGMAADVISGRIAVSGTHTNRTAATRGKDRKEQSHPFSRQILRRGA